MKKLKILSVILIVLALIFIIPNISKAAEKKTYQDETQNVEWEYEEDENGNVINLRLKTSTFAGTINIPAEIEEKNVISLSGSGTGAFEGYTGLTGVTIPNSVITIGNEAFRGCTSLKTVTIPNSVTKIGDQVFSGCPGITTVTLSNTLSSIGEYAFSGCSGLKAITIPNSVTTIGKGAFSGCRGLKELTLSNSLTEIRAETFYNCSGLTSVIIPESVTSIRVTYTTWGTGAFEDCTNLEKILIPDSVATIEADVFDGCEKLTIYGNDNQASKQYAEENKIAFDYIENWDKPDSGKDVTAPTVESIVVTYASVMNYDKDANRSMYMVPADAKLVINVTFSEEVEGTSVPTLTIKFGDGQNIQVTEGTVGGSKITYIYTVKSTDKGVMTVVDYKGGNIKDAAGNVAILSHPTLKVQYSSGDLVYANGTATSPSGTGSGTGSGAGTGTGTGSGSTGSGNGSTGTGSGSQNGGTGAPSKDNTTLQGKLPQTGMTYAGIVIAIVMAGFGVVSFKKYKKYKI